MVQCRKFIYVRFWSYFANTSFTELFTSRTDKVNWFTMLLISDSNSQLSSYVSLRQRFPVLQWKNLRVEVYVTAPQGIKSIYFLWTGNDFIKYQKENSLQLNCKIQYIRKGNDNPTTLVKPPSNNSYFIIKVLIRTTQKMSYQADSHNFFHCLTIQLLSPYSI